MIFCSLFCVPVEVLARAVEVVLPPTATELRVLGASMQGAAAFLRNGLIRRLGPSKAPSAAGVVALLGRSCGTKTLHAMSVMIIETQGQ